MPTHNGIKEKCLWMQLLESSPQLHFWLFQLLASEAVQIIWLSLDFCIFRMDIEYNGVTYCVLKG